MNSCIGSRTQAADGRFSALVSDRASQQRVFGVSAVLFFASATLTTIWCESMSVMGNMRMPGGWTMSMTWMPMPGQTWLGAGVSFLSMWIVMMIAMMLPSLAPALWRYSRAIVTADNGRRHWLTALVGVAYFLMWAVCGIAVFPMGMALAGMEMQHAALARTAPTAAGVIVLVAGAVQFTSWKARQLTCCREVPGPAQTLRADARTAWRHGLGLGLRCICTCASLTAILLVLGVMDLWAMALVTAAVTGERLAPNGVRAARVIGVIVVLAGVFLITRAAGDL